MVVFKKKSPGPPRENQMVRAKNASNGLLEEALATLIQNQASFLARMSEIDARVAEMDRVGSERFARIEALLIQHSRILEALPDAIGDKIGFKAPGS
jgi:hypothetical protein